MNRSTFGKGVRLSTDAFQTKDQRTDQAYRFRDATMKVEDALADARGTRPR